VTRASLDVMQSLGAGNVDGGFFQEIHRLDVAL
jgi:hypothetical protein